MVYNLTLKYAKGEVPDEHYKICLPDNSSSTDICNIFFKLEEILEVNQSNLSIGMEEEADHEDYT